jgi:two-component sensor histidine kinase
MGFMFQYAKTIVKKTDVVNYLNLGVDMPKRDMYMYCWRIQNNGRKFYDVSSGEYGKKIRLNNIYSIGNYFFIDFSLANRTNIRFDIEEIRVKLTDKKRTKATNSQDIELEPVEIDLSFMLEQIADELYGVLQEKSLTCEVDVAENLEVYGDPDKLARVFDNLLRNAVAYCYDNSKIEIHAQLKKDDIEIIFTNEGNKIPGDMLQTIFEKFYRVDGSRSSGTGGAGLGLAIAKEIVELHGGSIRAKSDDIKTQFIVTLPSKDKGQQKEGENNEIHTRSRYPFRGKSGRR